MIRREFIVSGVRWRGDATRSFVTNEQQFLAAVEEGKQALREGRVIDHDTVVAAFERIMAPSP